MSAVAFPRIELNGETVRADDLRHLVQTNYGHFTAFRVEAGGVRGLDLHLDRLQRATRELFGSELDRERVRGYVRHAAGGERNDISVRVNVFARAFDRERPDRAVDVDVLVIAAAASAPATATAPLRVKSFRYARELAAVKHVGTFALFHYRRLARLAGFDDAVFTDEQGRIGEGSVWNVGFVDRDGAVLWPDAPHLDGVGMQLLKAGRARAGAPSATRTIRLGELPGFRAAFFTNSSSPVRPIAAIDAHAFTGDDAAMEKLLRAYHANEPQPL